MPTSRQNPNHPRSLQKLNGDLKEERKKGIRALRGGGGGAARRPRRLLDVAMDGEAAEEEQERDRKRAADVGAGEGRGARQRRTPWFVVIAAGRWQERAQPEARSCEDGTVER